MEEYSQEFYQSRHLETKHSASEILSILLGKLPPINSAVDLGCGVGTWLSVLKEKGVKDIQGYDGFWVDQNLLEIPKDCFQAVDLNIKLPVNERYDLAISIEVAEHLPETFAKDFISSLTSLSDIILFSAAIPHQGGNHHYNEQWPDYWVKIFCELDYVAYDFIRSKIWLDKNIPFWYKQNILVFVKKSKSSMIQMESTANVMNLIHPDLYFKKVSALNVGVKGSFKLLCKAIKKYLTF